MENLKETLDDLVEKYETPSFILNDPIQIPRMFTSRKDIEVAAFLTATIAWGKRDMILANGYRIIRDIMGMKPYLYIQHGLCDKVPSMVNLHRTFFGRDFIYMCRGLKHVYDMCGDRGMEAIFSDPKRDLFTSIDLMRNMFKDANGGMDNRNFANPATSACKRMCMMLRWLVRRNSPVDLGLWKNVSPRRLIIPLDVHVLNTVEHLHLIDGNIYNNRKTAERITEALVGMCPEDPIKYDFALFGYGIDYIGDGEEIVE